MADTTYIANFIKDNRNRSGLTQEQLAEKAGVGLRFIREMEQGKSELEQSKKELQEDIEHANIELEHAKQEILRSKMDIERSKKEIEESKKLQEEIIDDFIKLNIIKSKKDLSSYKLSDEELIVNGVKQPDSIHKRFKEKYGKGDNWTIKYNYDHNEAEQ